MKHLSTILLLCFMATVTFAQFEEKKVPGKVNKITETETKSLDISVPAPEHIDESRTTTFDPQAKRITLASFVDAQNRPKLLQSNNWGVPTWISGEIKSPITRTFTTPEAEAIAYLSKNVDILPFKDAHADLNVIKIDKDEANNMTHVKVQQLIHGIEVFGGEVWVHLEGEKAQSMTGRMYPAQIALPTNHLSAEEAYVRIKTHFSSDWKSSKPTIDGYEVEQYAAKLQWYPIENEKNLRLAYVADVYPDYLHKHFIAIDATNGEVLNTYMSMCYFHGTEDGHHAHSSMPTSTTDEKKKDLYAGELNHTAQMMGDETATAPDLFGINRTFHVIQENGIYYMVDISRPMYNASASSLPSNPVGGIRTYDGLNNPFNSSFSYSQITSTNNTWSDRASVSAHYNAGQAYEYFRTTYNRNSINGSGSTVTSFIHVTDENDNPMDNAFWNGEAMFYGDGNQGFFSLARGLDVAGHEISHGVVQNTANLNYQNESGALNESFADIFGAMIDRDDWLIGEDVVKTSVFPSGALRSMIDPTQGLSPGSNGYQPGHYSTRYTGSQDRGGVHINSGIPNKAFYHFATAVGKEKAEQVYYRALTSYLTRNSNFADCRASVMQAAKDLYGTTECEAAASAFDQVGVTGANCGGGGPVVPTDDSELPVNPGADLILYVNDNTDNLKLIDGTGGVIVDPFTSETPLSKPSVSDDGSRIVFVNGQNQIYMIQIDWTGGTFNDFVLQSDQIWRNTCISKDGTLVAATTSNPENSITVFNLATSNGLTFPLTNPTTGGVATGDVLYSDAMEFDYSGRYILYDAVNEISGTNENIQYWDIGIIRAWDKENNDFGDGQISKVFSGLPEGISVGNPTLSKTRPNVMAYDVLEEGFFNDSYYLYASNIETNKTAQIYPNTVVSYPSYSRTDDRILFNAQNTYNENVVGQISLLDDRITPTGDASLFLDQAYWATWFANGTRNINVGTIENLINEFITISPNPADAFITIKLGEEAGQPESINIFNTEGKLLKTIKTTPSETNLIVSTQDFPSGNYLIELNTSEGKSFQPIIIQH